MIGISTVDFSLDGALLLTEDKSASDLRSVGRRLTRSKTLDGGTVLDDAGFSDGDRTMEMNLLNVSEADFAVLRDMATLHNAVLLSTVDGVFYGGIESLRLYRGAVSLRFLAESKVSA